MNKVENELRKYAEFVTPKHISDVMLAGADEIARLEAQNDMWVETCDRIIQAEAESWWKKIPREQWEDAANYME